MVVRRVAGRANSVRRSGRSARENMATVGVCDFR